MANSYVGGAAAGRTGNSNSTVDVSLSSGLTGGSNAGVSAGDLVMVTIVTATQGRAPSVAVAGYTNLTAQHTTASTYDVSVQTSYKFMGSTPDSVVTIPAQGDVADGQAYLVQVFRGVDPSTPQDVTATYATGSGTSNKPNPAAITPVTAGAWIVACGGGASATGTTLFTTATLTNFLTQNGADTNDATVGGGYYTAWISGAYDPAAFGGGSNNVANSWGATTIALRPAPIAQTLTPNLYSNGEVFYTPTITVGAVSLTPALYENANTFYTHEVTQPAAGQDLTPTLYENINTFYAPALSLNLNATRYDNSNTFYDATVTAGAVTLTVDLFTNDNTFYSATVDRGAVNLSASLYSNTNEFYAAEVTQGAVTLTASLFESSNTFYQHSVGGISAGQDLTASLYPNDNTFYVVSVTTGAVTVSAELFTNSNEFYVPSISVGGVTLTLEIFVNSNTFYSPAVTTGAVTLSASLYSNTKTYYEHSIFDSIADIPASSFIVQARRRFTR